MTTANNTPEEENIVGLFEGKMTVNTASGKDMLMQAIKARCITDVLDDSIYAKMPGNNPTTYRIDFEEYGGKDAAIISIRKIKDEHNDNTDVAVWEPEPSSSSSSSQDDDMFIDPDEGFDDDGDFDDDDIQDQDYDDDDDDGVGVGVGGMSQDSSSSSSKECNIQGCRPSIQP